MPYYSDEVVRGYTDSDNTLIYQATTTTPGNTALYALDEAKKDLGLFGQDEFDARLRELIAAAQQLLSFWAKISLTLTKRVDYFAGLARFLVLSATPAMTQAFSLKWLSKSGDVEFTSLNTASAPNDDLVIDASGGSIAVALTESGEERAVSLLASSPFSVNVRNPLRVEYMAGGLAEKGEDAAKQAVKELVRSMWRSEGIASDEARRNAMDLIAVYKQRRVRG